MEEIKRKQREVDAAILDEERLLLELQKRRQNKTVTFATENEPTSPPPTSVTTTVKKNESSPTKKVSFAADAVQKDADQQPEVVHESPEVVSDQFPPLQFCVSVFLSNPGFSFCRCCNMNAF